MNNNNINNGVNSFYHRYCRGSSRHAEAGCYRYGNPENSGNRGTFGSHRWRLIRRHEQIVRGNQSDVKSAKRPHLAAPLYQTRRTSVHASGFFKYHQSPCRDHHRRFPDVVVHSSALSPFYINHLSHSVVSETQFQTAGLWIIALRYHPNNILKSGVI